MKSLALKISTTICLTFIFTTLGCTQRPSGVTAGRSGNPFADADARVGQNIENLMGLSVGMTKNQVYSLAGNANYIEGYDWGSAWFYKIRTGGNEGTLSDKDVEKRYMPVVFDNTDRVMGYGSKFYDQTLSDLGTGQF